MVLIVGDLVQAFEHTDLKGYVAQDMVQIRTGVSYITMTKVEWAALSKAIDAMIALKDLEAVS